MGHDIKIFSVIIVDGRARVIGVVDTAYMSYNWSRYENVCEKHFLEGNGQCDCNDLYFKKLWHVDKIFGRSGAYTAKTCNEALTFLRKCGIHPSVPDPNNSNWGWGLKTYEDGRDGDMPPREHASVFAYHLHRFYKLGLSHPREYFRGDHEIYKITDDNGNTVWIDDEEEDEEEEEEEHARPDTSNRWSISPKPIEPVVDNSTQSPVTYFRHPSKGNFRVHSFKTAIEVYGICMSTGDDRAEAWYDLAMMMHDAPGKK